MQRLAEDTCIAACSKLFHSALSRQLAWVRAAWHVMEVFVTAETTQGSPHRLTVTSPLLLPGTRLLPAMVTLPPPGIGMWPGLTEARAG